MQLNVFLIEALIILQLMSFNKQHIQRHFMWESK